EDRASTKQKVVIEWRRWILENAAIASPMDSATNNLFLSRSRTMSSLLGTDHHGPMRYSSVQSCAEAVRCCHRRMLLILTLHITTEFFISPTRQECNYAYY